MDIQKRLTLRKVTYFLFLFSFFRVKCPYCPIEQSPSDARQIFFWSPSRLNASCFATKYSRQQEDLSQGWSIFSLLHWNSWSYWMFWDVLSMKIFKICWCRQFSRQRDDKWFFVQRCVTEKHHITLQTLSGSRQNSYLWTRNLGWLRDLIILINITCEIRTFVWGQGY